MSKKLLPLVENEQGEYEKLIKKVSVWDGSTLDSSWKVLKDDGYYHISNANQMAHYLSLESNANANVNVKLDIDCDLSKGDSKTYELATEGTTFDGQFHKIKYNNTIKLTKAFASSNSGGYCTVKNIIIEGMYVYTGTTYDQGQFLGRNETRNGNTGQLFENVLLLNCKWEIAGASYGNLGWYYNRYGTVGKGITYNGLFFVNCSWANGNNTFHKNISTSGIYNNGFYFINCENKNSSSLDTNISAVNYGLVGTWNTNSGETYEDLNTLIEDYNNTTSYEKIKIGDDGFVVFESYNPNSEGVLKYRKMTEVDNPYDGFEIPEGSDFLWVARDYDEDNNIIPNRVEGGYFDNLSINNTPTLEIDSDKNKYLKFTNVNQYLYHSLDENAQSNLLGNGENNYYTIIFKANYTSLRTGILMNLTKTKTSYFNMVWTNSSSGKLEVSLGNNSSVISNVQSLNDYYFKYERTNESVKLTCLDTGETNTYSLSGTQYIDDEIRFMSAGHSWSYWDKFYGVYGIPRQLNEKEELDVKRLLGYYDDKEIYTYKEFVGEKVQILSNATQLNTTYPSTYDEPTNYWIITHNANSTSSGIEFTLTQDCTIDFECIISSEGNYDYGCVYRNGTRLKAYSGVSTNTFSQEFNAGDILKLTYGTDGSNLYNENRFRVKMSINENIIDGDGISNCGYYIYHYYKLGDEKLLLINNKNIRN